MPKGCPWCCVFLGGFSLELKKMFPVESDYLHVFVWPEGMERGL